MSELKDISIHTSKGWETVKVAPLKKSAAVPLTDSAKFKEVFRQWYLGLSGGDLNSGYVSSCSNVWGLAFAKAVFRLYDVDDNEEITEHPIVNLLRNPFPGMTSAQMKYRISDDLIYEGDNYWLKIRDKSVFGTPRYLYPLYADRISTYPMGRDIIEYYEYNTGGGIMKIEPKDILHIRNFGRSSNIKGTPVISKIADVRTTESLQIRYRKQLYEKAGFLGPMFSTAKAMGQDEFDRTYDMLKKKYSGEDNNFNFALFDNDLKPISTAYSPKDMQIIDDRNLNRDEICAAFGVNKLLFGLSENIQRGNADTVYYVFYSTIIDPLLDHIDQSLTQSFRVDFTLNGRYPYVIKHDILAQRDRETDATIDTKYSEAGIIKPSEIRESLGYEFDPVLDEIWLEKMKKSREQKQPIN